MDCGRGTVYLAGVEEPLPPINPPPAYFLTQAEGIEHLEHLKKIIQGSEEIAFEKGSLSGPDLEYKINPERSVGCKLVFVMVPGREE